MNKAFKILLFVLAFGLFMTNHLPAKAQCAQCAANVATNKENGGKAVNGLNHGIMYLLAAPYLAVCIVGYVWYKKYRRKEIELKMGGEKFNLN